MEESTLGRQSPENLITFNQVIHMSLGIAEGMANLSWLRAPPRGALHISCCLSLTAVLLLTASLVTAGTAPAPTKIEATIARDTEALLQVIHTENKALTASLGDISAQRDAAAQSRKQMKQLTERVKTDFADAREILDSIGHTAALGPLMLQHRNSLPTVEEFARDADKRKQQIAEAGIQRLAISKQSRQYGGTEQALEQLTAQLPQSEQSIQSRELHELLGQRKQLLQAATRETQALRDDLRQLDEIEQNLIQNVQAYRAFLNQHLWWLRAAEPTRLRDLHQMLTEARELLTLPILTRLAQVAMEQLLYSTFFWLTALLALALIAKRRALIVATQETAILLRRPTTDRFAHTVRAIALTLMTVTPLPLLLAVSGWRLQLGSTDFEIARALGHAMLPLALLLFVLHALRQMGIERGVATAHLRWPDEPVALLHRSLGWLIAIQIPAALLAWFSLALYPEQSGGLAARLGFLAFHLALAGFTFSVLHPNRGVFARSLQRLDSRFLVRAYLLIYALIVLLPLGLIVELFSGYAQSAIGVSDMFLNTLWMTVFLILLYSLAKRWVFLTRRQLAYKAAVQRRAALLEAREAEKNETTGESTGELEIDEPEINLAALSDSSLGLIAISIVLLGLFGLILIWSPLIPALQVLDDWQLWSQRITIDGQPQQYTTTLVDLAMALAYAFGTVVLVNRLPSVLQIVLLQRARISKADHYTVTKLATYTVVAVGTFMVLHSLGAQWAQLQWLVAAFSVGIGFGLQEIVANFVSGLIILFERPIRVGDVVTVGDTSGLVTKIRIRATTIRDWDRKELLVPNKDLITGRVLNWSLSDATTRLVIELGVAYDTDVAKALSLMRQAAEENEQILNKPAPLLSFERFGDNGLHLILRAYVGEIEHRIPTLTQLRLEIIEKFRRSGITIAYPQQDVHFDSGKPLNVNLVKHPNSSLID